MPAQVDFDGLKFGVPANDLVASSASNTMSAIRNVMTFHIFECILLVKYRA